MHLISTLFFAISSSMDSFVIGISYGIKKVKINLLNNIIVAIISGMGTFVSMFFGSFIYKIASPYVAKILGSILLIILGIYMIITFVKEIKLKNCKENLNFPHSSALEKYDDIIKHPDILDTNKSHNIELNEALSLGLILCINNIGLGIGASFTGLNIYLTSAFSILFSVIFVPVGLKIGSKLILDKYSKYADLISAAIIIILGIYELF